METISQCEPSINRSMTFTSHQNYPILMHTFILHGFIVNCGLFLDVLSRVALDVIFSNPARPDLGLQIRPGPGLEPNVLELEA